MKRILLVFFVVAAPLLLFAQQQDVLNLTWQLPPDNVRAIVDAEPAPAVSLSPDRSHLMLINRSSLPPLAELAQPELRLGGLRINPATNGPSRSASFVGLTLANVSDGNKRTVRGIPSGAAISNLNWSPDGKLFAFTITTQKGIELWLGRVDNASASRLGRFFLNDAYYGSAFTWSPDSKTIFARLIPDRRSAAPEADLTPPGPIVQENLGRSAPARTYQDLLQNAHDESLFDYYFRSQIAAVNISNGRVRNLGQTGLHRGMSVSPDGRYLLVTQTEKPFSYLVPASRFPMKTEVWDMRGQVVETVAEIPMQDQIPIGFGATSTGPRSITWRNDASATLMWVEAQDGGNPRVSVDHRDYVYVRGVPFQGEPQILAKLETRFAGVMWGHDGLALVMERWFSNRNEKIWHVQPGNLNAEQRLIRDRNYEDIYNDPGSPQMQLNASGNAVLLTGPDGMSLYLTGQGASEDGNFPFLDTYNVLNGESERLWQSEAPKYEFVITLLDQNAERIITRRETVTEPPNYILMNRLDKSEIKMTDFTHPLPELINVQRESVTYTREDGVPLSGTLYLPPGYDKDHDGRLPLMVWAYPREFRSADAAGQRSDSPYRFNTIGFWGPQWLVTQGYAVLDNATMPIVGEGESEPNDTFIGQLVMNSEAAINAIAEMGIADPNRAALGGHSYGAFMTANVLAHSDLFKAGIARSGAYNRSLTPFGFQREERTLWDDTALYIQMSPFFHADKINQTILLIHGEADNNSGTFPMQSERLYQAIKGLGGTARLVMLPHESHGYRARESVMHMLWETLIWLDTYVKNAESISESQ